MNGRYEFEGNELAGRSIAFGKKLSTMDTAEGLKVVELCGGTPQKSVTKSTEVLVVSNDVMASVNGSHEVPIYVKDALGSGINVISEDEFWHLIGMRAGDGGVADRWIIVDDELAGGKVDVSNEPGWDGHKAPYKLFIQHTTIKSTTDGGWNIIDCGPLDERGFPKFGSQPWYSRPDKKDMGRVPATDDELDYRDLIGKVVIADAYAPESCAYLFDGLQYCAEFDLQKLDSSKATSMANMFRGCSSIKTLLDIGSLDTSNMTSMSGMFFGCMSLRVIDMLKWDMNSLRCATSMFSNSPAFALVNDKAVQRLQSSEVDASNMFDSGTMYGTWLKSSAI
ncbi:BspA family leucine-rich repeat surface protein [Parafannyhessea umbonata]|uniref:Surface protein n=1 Tax=Parafannyhessea umbonata TaxID=604330 RepID=A0A1H1N0H6_9ACTN|nr:BspA family leucine-rich repeat surface protein [Parafannyhessea umbonata]SDR92400.1 surface protein [Parafannyhessea umbonata]